MNEIAGGFWKGAKAEPWGAFKGRMVRMIQQRPWEWAAEERRKTKRVYYHESQVEERCLARNAGQRSWILLRGLFEYSWWCLLRGGFNKSHYTGVIEGQGQWPHWSGLASVVGKEMGTMSKGNSFCKFLLKWRRQQFRREEVVLFIDGVLLNILKCQWVESSFRGGIDVRQKR